MSRTRTVPLMTAVLVAAPIPPATAQGPDTDAVACEDCVPKRPITAIGQTLLINVGVNRFDAWVGGQAWARVSTRSWSRNVQLGWEWDEDGFGTNMFSHPYHGGLYFNAARANGLGFWESAPLAFLGSWTWEYLGETHRPALNDFFMTSFGGIALGEVFHRLGARIRDNTKRGGARVLREIAALPLDPWGGLNRILRGEWLRMAANPGERNPAAIVIRLGVGGRVVGDSAPGVPGTASASGMILADLDYGDPFLRPFRAPFDAFSLRAQLSPGRGGLTVLRGTGRLYGGAIGGATGWHRHQLEVNQRYEYANNPAYRFGAQSVEVGIVSRWRIRGAYHVRTRLTADAIILGAIDASSTGVGERTYDFGPGLGFTLAATLERSGVRYLTVSLQPGYLHSVSGATADHVISFGSLEANVPLVRGFGVGVHSGYYTRLSHYTDRPMEERAFPELRLYVSRTVTHRTHTMPPR